jgi:signal transduction histidine kinase
MLNSSANRRYPAWLLAATSVYLVAVFVADVQTPERLDIWVLYLPLILLQIRFSASRQVIGTAIATTALMTLETYLTHHDFGLPFILGNLLLRVVALWLVAIAGLIIINNVIRRKELEYEVLQIAAGEQRRIGQELHDSVGQELTGLGLMANALDQRLQTAKVETQIMDRLTSGISRVQEHVRTLSHGLIPVPIEAKGLLAALEDLAVDTTERSGVPVHFSSPDQLSVGDHAVATHLYRIAQEAVNNALRHGHPENINLTLHGKGSSLSLTIEDDGVGIRYPLPDNRGKGLQIMQHRAEQIGGVLQLRRRKEGGTIVTCTLTHNPQQVPNDDPDYAEACQNPDR